jgi:hypothetical protein
MFNYRYCVFSIAMITLLAGCATAPATRSQALAVPTEQPTSTPLAEVAARDERRPTQTAKLSAAAHAAADRALADLAHELGVSQSTIEILGVQPRYGASTTSDSAGPPDGWHIRLGVGTDVYLYQVDARGVLKRLPARR